MIILQVLNYVGFYMIVVLELFLFDKFLFENGVVYDGFVVSIFYLDQINNCRNIFEGQELNLCILRDLLLVCSNLL